MEVANTLSAYSEHVLQEFGLCGVSLQVCGTTSGGPAMSKFLDYNLPDQASFGYREHGIFALDPFTNAEFNEDSYIGGCEDVFPPSEPRIAAQYERSRPFWEFLSGFDLEIVGVSTRRLAPGIYTAAGFLRCTSRRYRDEIATCQLKDAATMLHNLMAAESLQMSLNGAAAQGHFSKPALKMMRSEALPDLKVEALSRREIEIARLVSNGRQNKYIAHILNISEHTVGNHLRRIYKKLGIHNRSSLTMAIYRYNRTTY